MSWSREGRATRRLSRKTKKTAGWQGVESTADQVRGLGRRSLALTADVSSGADAVRVASAALEEFGRIDILVNNAAAPIGPDRVPLTELTEKVWREVLDVKLTGSFLMCHAVLPAMIAQRDGASIINVSSIAGKQGAAAAAAYCAACAGLQGLTQALAMELAPHNIRVNAVCPGATATARMDGFRNTHDWEAHIRKHVPLGRAAEDHDFGRFIAWLCGPDASYITGQSLNFDGGVVMW